MNDETLLCGGNDAKDASGGVRDVPMEAQLKKNLDPHSNTGRYQQEDEKLTKAGAVDASMGEERGVLKRESDAIQSFHAHAQTPSGGDFPLAPERKAASIPGPPYTGMSKWRNVTKLSVCLTISIFCVHFYTYC